MGKKETSVLLVDEKAYRDVLKEHLEEPTESEIADISLGLKNIGL